MGRVPRNESHNKAYKNPDNDPRGEWRSGDVRSPNLRENLKYDVVTPSGKIIKPPQKGWRWSEERLNKMREHGEVIFSKDETRLIRKIYLADQLGRVPESIWFGDDVGTTRVANREIKDLDLGELFDTPKPERLIERILTLASSKDDIILDSFLGSGTTAAVAHKMGRRWIGIELGDHCDTHCLPRLKKVCDGEDQGGITKAVDWRGVVVFAITIWLLLCSKKTDGGGGLSIRIIGLKWWRRRPASWKDLPMLRAIRITGCMAIRPSRILSM